MSYLLDTCTLSELRGKVPLKTQIWFESKNQDLFYISVVTIAELWDGIERLSPSKKKKDLEDWFYGDIYSRFKDMILSIDDRIAKEWGTMNSQLLKRGITLGVQDLYIAATAKSHGLELVTLNTKDFTEVGIPIINPWE